MQRSLVDKYSPETNTFEIHFIETHTGDVKSLEIQETNDTLSGFDPVTRLGIIRLQQRLKHFSALYKTLQWKWDSAVKEGGDQTCWVCFCECNEISIDVIREVIQENDELYVEKRPWLWCYYKFEKEHSIKAETTGNVMNMTNVMMFMLRMWKQNPTNEWKIDNSEVEFYTSTMEAMKKPVLPAKSLTPEENAPVVANIIETLTNRKFSDCAMQTTKKIVNLLLDEYSGCKISMSDSDAERFGIKVSSPIMRDVDASLMNKILATINSAGGTKTEAISVVFKKDDLLATVKFTPENGPPGTPVVPATRDMRGWFPLYSQASGLGLYNRGDKGAVDHDSRRPDTFMALITLRKPTRAIQDAKKELVSLETATRAEVYGSFTPVVHPLATPIPRHRNPPPGFNANNNNNSNSDFERVPPSPRLVPLASPQVAGHKRKANYEEDFDTRPSRHSSNGKNNKVLYSYDEKTGGFVPYTE